MFRSRLPICVVTASLLLLIVVGEVLLAQAAPVEGRSSLSPGAVVALEPAEQVVDLGATFTVRVTVEQASNVGGYEFRLGFDPSVIKVLDVEIGGFLGSTGRNVMPLWNPDLDKPGMTTCGAITYGDAPGAEGAGELAVISLQALREGVTDLDLYDVTLFDTGAGLIEVTVKDGRVRVGGGSMSPPTPTAEVAVTPTEMPTVGATGTPAETPVGRATPRATAIPTRTGQASPRPDTTSPTATSGPMVEAATEAPEPTTSARASETGESPPVTEVSPATPSATSQAVASASEGESPPVGAAERPPSEREREPPETSTRLVHWAIGLAIAGLITIAAGGAMLALRKGKRA